MRRLNNVVMRHDPMALTLAEHRQVDTTLSRIRNQLIKAHTGKYKKVSITDRRLHQAFMMLTKLRGKLDGACLQRHGATAWRSEANDDALDGATLDQLVEAFVREVHFAIDGRVSPDLLALVEKAEQALVAFRNCVASGSERDKYQERRAKKDLSCWVRARR